MSSRVTGLWLHPVKGFEPQPVDRIEVRDRRVVGDRVLGFRYADAPEGDTAWGEKRRMVVGMNTPAIARLRVQHLPDPDGPGRLRLSRDDTTLADAELDVAGRTRLAAVVADLPEVGLPSDSEHRPLRLVGDGVTPLLHDSPRGLVSLHSRGSVEALSEVVGAPLTDTRFRSNVVIDGVEPLAELGWVGRQIELGGVRFTVRKALTRCLATHVDPITGRRDHNVLRALTRGLGLDEPVFGIQLVAQHDGGVALGDAVSLLAADEPEIGQLPM